MFSLNNINILLSYGPKIVRMSIFGKTFYMGALGDFWLLFTDWYESSDLLCLLLITYFLIPTKKLQPAQPTLWTNLPSAEYRGWGLLLMQWGRHLPGGTEDKTIHRHCFSMARFWRHLHWRCGKYYVMIAFSCHLPNQYFGIFESSAHPLPPY